MKTHTQTLATLLTLLTLLLSAYVSSQAAQPTDEGTGTIHVLTIDGAIGPATSDFITRGVARAEADGAYMVILRMDTPGGLDGAMRDIIQSILDARIPIASYVHPPGARAASAGTYILYASHIAAMAPATNLGAATPVQLGGAPPPAGEDSAAEGQEDARVSASEAKIINDARAYIRGLAELRGRNAEWAESAVTEAASLAAEEALADNVIDIVARDVGDLLLAMDGQRVSIDGESRVLRTEGKRLEYIEPGWRVDFLSIITNPNLILILGMIGIYGLIIEFYSPGFGLAGTVGAICLLLAGYGLQLLPLNYAGLGLILLGVALVVAEALAPSFGILGVGGIASLTIGAVIMVDTDLTGFQVSLPLVAAIAVFFAILLAASLRMFMNVRKRGLVSGVQTMIGETGESLADFDVQGQVRVQGEIWNARTTTPLRKGDKIKVLDVDGMNLLVEKT